VDRRPFIGTLTRGLLATPLAPEAQPAARIPMVGLLLPTTPAGSAHLVEAFRQGLRELGDVEGNTFILLLHYAEGRSERLLELARDLVSHNQGRRNRDQHRCDDCGGQARDAGDSNRNGLQWRPGRDWVRGEPGAAGGIENPRV
jgi:hypothetical protein